MRKVTGIVLIVVLIIFLTPYVIGIAVQSAYQKLIRYYNAQGNVVVQLEHYHRGWFQSRAKLHVKIVNSSIMEMVQASGLRNPKLEFDVEQQIQHGPVLLQNTTFLPCYIGLASLFNQVIFSDDMQKILQINSTSPIKMVTYDLLTLTGNYFQYIDVSSFKFDSVVAHFHIKNKQGINAQLWVYPFKNHFSGEMTIPDADVAQGDKYRLKEAGAALYFDTRLSRSGLWLGKTDIVVSELVLQNRYGDKMVFSDLDFKGVLSESAGVLSGSRNFKVQKININDEVFGPLNLHVSMGGINANAMSNMFDVYRKISRQGELYESQLQLKLMSMLPTLFTKEFNVSLRSFSLAAKEGVLAINGRMTWPNGESTANDLFEVVQDADAKAELRISKPFAHRLIGYASHLPFLRGVSRERQRELVGLADDIDLASRRNYLYLAMLVDNKQLSEETAISLLQLQQQDAGIIDYAKAIKTLYLNAQISVSLSYMIFWQYLDVTQHVALLKQALDVDDQSLKKEIQDQFAAWIKQGYITQDKKDYKVILHKENGVLKMNDKEVLSLKHTNKTQGG